MQSHKLVVKLFADGADKQVLEAVIPVFHGWIQNQSFTDHLLIDVADYAHVPNGPGTVLVSHEANVHFDHENGVGVLYIRKQPVAGASSFRERLAAVVRGTVQAAAKLEQDLPGVRFRTNELVFRINDRLLAPNDEATYRAVAPDLQKFFADLYHGDLALEHRHDSLRLFEVRVKSTATPSLTDLLARLEKLAPAAAPAAV